MKARNINLIMLLMGVIIFAVLFVNVKGSYDTKTEEAEAENISLQPRLEVLEEHYANIATYEANIQEAGDYIDEQVTYYPAGVQEEDFLVWVLDWEDSVGHEVTSVDLNTGYSLYTFPCYVGEDDALVDMTAGVISVSLDADVSYKQLIKGIDYIYDEEMTTALESVSLSYNEETGLLGTSYKINKYYLAYEGVTYEASKMPSVSQGLTSLFPSE